MKPSYPSPVPAPPNGSPLICEIRATVTLAAPVVVVQLGLMLMGTVDTMMLGRLSTEALAAGALGNTVSFGVLILPLGLFMGLDPLIAQAHGAGDPAAVARHFRRGLVLALVVSIPVAWAHLRLGAALEPLGQSPEVAALASDYLRAIALGVPAFLIFLVLRQTIQAMSLVWPAVVAVVVSNLFNAGADYALIFGRLGFDQLGVYGSGIATSLSRYVLAGSLLVAAWWRYRSTFGRARWSDLLPRNHFSLLRLGLPVSIQLGFEMWVFMTVGLMMGSLGAVEFGGHQIALNLAALSFMVPAGIAAAAATRVGNAVGRGDRPGMLRASRVSLCLGVAVMSVSALCFALLPRLLARAYTLETEVIAMAAVLIPIAALFQIADGTQVVATGVLRGAADTRWPAVIAFSGFWLVGLPVGTLLAFRGGFGPRGLWWGLTAGLVAVAALLVARVARRLRLPLESLRAERAGSPVAEG